jgi:class 3 adenylate cyclase/tetratricopeptide (TPR) repeat protein
MDITTWLRDLGLEQYEKAFAENAIDEEVLPELSDADLERLGVAMLGHRRKLLKAIHSLPAAGDGGIKTGSSPVEEGERRQVAVLFVDLAGYSAMSHELDPEETHALLERFFTLTDTIVNDHGGRVDKHIGDCVMGVFGAPTGHGNDAERAVRAALAIRDAMPGLVAETGHSLGVHMGIAGGQVVASGTGSASHREYTVTGDSVNLASRLTGIAKGGEILLSNAVRIPLADKFDCADAGTFSVKGFTEPVRAWRLVGLRPERSGFRSIVGRDRELRQFQAALANCQTDGRGQTLYIRGDAGIGKSRLILEWQRQAAEAGFSCHTGLVLDFGTGSGRDAVRALVRSLLGLEIASAAEAAAVKALRDGLVAAEEAVFLNDLLDLEQPAELRRLYEAMDNESRIRGKRQLVSRIVRELSRHRRRLLVLEDIHWAGHNVLTYAAELAGAVSECPALLVMTSRFEGDPLDQEWRARAGFPPLTTVDLGPLRAEDSRAIASAIFGADRGDIDHCVRRAAGNPLFLEQLLRHLRENREHEVPGSVQSLVQARLDRLALSDKTALQAASVFGQRFEGNALAFLLRDNGDIARRLTQQLLVRPQGNDTFLFAHALVRDAIYDSLLRSRRRALHRRAAEWFSGSREQVLRAEHLERAEDAEAPAAYLGAARSQAAEYRYEEAVRLAAKGLSLASSADDRFELTCYRAELLNDLGATSDALTAYTAALDAARNDADRCRAWIGLAEVKRIVDDLDAASAALDLAEAAAARLELTALSAHAHFLRGNLLFPRGDIDGCLREHQLSLELARRSGSHEFEAAALGGLGDAEYIRGRMGTSYKHYSRCVDICQKHGFGRIEVANRPMAAITLGYVEGPKAALDVALAAVAAAERVGHQRAATVAHQGLFFSAYELGDFASAWKSAEVSLGLARQLGARRFEAESLACRGVLHAATGHSSAGLDDINQAIAIFRETGMTYMGPAVLGMLAMASEDKRVRDAALTEGEALLSARSICHNHLLFRRYAIDACLSAGDWQAADHHAAALHEFVKFEPWIWAVFFADRGRALAAHGRGDRDEALGARLLRLKTVSDTLGFIFALPAIVSALAERRLA